jgi:gliding motility-associated-like protein
MTYDQAYIMDLDNGDNVYFFGQTLGLYPVTSGVYSNTGAPQFIHKLNNNLNNTIFSTVFGSVNSTEINITPTALLVDVCSNIYAVGWGGNVNNSGNTFSMAVTPDAFKSTTDGSDFYLFNLSANATNLIYASYFGENGGVGDHVDGGTSRFDKSGIVYEAVCASCGGTNSFPVTSGVAGPDNNSFNCNMAGFKFNFDLTSLQIITATATPPTGCAPLAVDFTYTATKPGTEYFWDFGDGTTSTSRFPSHTYSAAGTYNVRFILRDPLNCNPVDSTTLTVSAGQRKTNTINKTICEGQSVTIGNQTFTTSGNYNVTLQAVGGCDSVVTLNLSVTNEIINNINQTICEGEIVAVGNSRYTQPGNYSDTIPTSALCDSIVNLTLTVKPKKYINLNRTICQGQSVTAGNQTFNTSGNFTVTIQSSLGCDSIISLNLLVNPVKTSSITNTICDGKSVTIGNQTFSEDGSYTISLTTSEGCDSIVNLTLIVNPLPEINAVADRTTAFPDEQIQLNVLSSESLSYNWTPIELLNNSTIQNPTAFITTPTWFVVSAENKTTLCTIEDSVFIGLDFLPCLKENIFIPNAFTPNGDDVNDKLFVRTTILNSFHFEIYDRWGNKVFSTDSITEGWDGNYKGQPAQVETYGYFLSGECIQGEKISLKGNLTLLR